MTPDTTTTDPAATTALTEALRVHPWIARAEQHGERIDVVVDPAALASDPEPGGLVAAHLADWAEVYDWTYRDGDPAPDPALDLSGWRATGTGDALPVQHMAEWADRTAALVLRTGPRRVLELGCGTGMLLHRLHPHVDAYVGTDVAGDVVDRLSALGLPGVTVVRAAAHEVGGPAVRDALAGAAPDCVVINSVTQVFPDAAHLAVVLRGAVGLVAPGGTVVVGDVRHSGLLVRHHRDLARTADHHATDADLDDRAARAATTDRELCLDPATIATAALGAGRDVRITVHAKTLADDSELSRYRFDAVLHVDAELHGDTGLHGGTPTDDTAATAIPGAAVDAAAADLPAAGLADLPPGTRIPGIRNGRLHPGALTAHDLHRATAHRDASVGLDPLDPHRLIVTLDDPTGRRAAVPAADLAGLGVPHEPLDAAARARLTQLVRRTARRAGVALPDRVRVLLPARPDVRSAHAAGLDALDPTARDRAVHGTALPDAIAVLDRIARDAMRTVLAAGIEPAPRHAWIVRRWREELAAHPREPGAAGDLGAACAALGYPEEMVAFFRAALGELPRLLRDELDLQALLFPDGEILTALGTYQHNLVNTYLNGALTDVMRTVAYAGHRPLRVLELGAGVGGSTDAVLAGLEGLPHDYLFTDVSRFFLDAARERFPGVRTGLLDVDALTTEDGPFDLVVAANVLHNAAHVRRTLRELAGLLAPGGVAAVVESTREHPIAMTSMQLLMSPRPGRPHPGATDLRAGTDRIFLGEQQWRAELAAAGLWPVFDLPGDLPLAATGQRLFLARRT